MLNELRQQQNDCNRTALYYSIGAVVVSIVVTLGCVKLFSKNGGTTTKKKKQLVRARAR
jgi:hypothetical protein